VGLFREHGKRTLQTGRLGGPDQLLRPAQSFASCVEIDHGPSRKPRRDSGSNAGFDRDLSRYSAPPWSAYQASRNGGFSVSRQPLDFGVGHFVDMGIAGTRACFAWARRWTRRPEMGS